MVRLGSALASAVAVAVAVLVTGGAPGRAIAAEVELVRATDGGRASCGLPPGWQRPELDDSAWIARQPAPPPLPVAPSASPDGGALPDGGEPPTPAATAPPPTFFRSGALPECPGTIAIRWRFDVSPDVAAQLATLTLRIRYLHGFAAYLNGVEVARRRLDPSADANAVATEAHGPEAERVFIPVRPGLLRRGANLLAIEVHHRAVGRPPLTEVELTGADGPRIVRGPYLVRLSEREVTVVFDTDLPTVGEVRWGPAGDAAATRTASDAPAQTHHALRLAPLDPGQTYRYAVSARGGTPAVTVEAGEASFHTPPPAGQPLRFLVYGDVRSGHDVHALLNRRIADEDPDLAIVTGDLVDRGSDEGDWERFFEVAGSLLRSLAIFPVPGNHDAARLGRGLERFLALFRWPFRPGEEEGAYYSFDAAGVHFVALDSNAYRSPRQLAWFERDLQAARKRGARAIFVYAHEPAWSQGLHGDNQIAIRDYVPIMERYGVSMFFGGHDHHYERGRVGQLDYLVTGGGGAELRWARCAVGVPGKRPCPPHVAAFANEHHYVVVEVVPPLFRVCPKRIDGTPIEACAQLKLR
jgi:hypothetical protein